MLRQGKRRNLIQLRRFMEAGGRYTKDGEISQEDYDRWRRYYPEYDTTHRWVKVPLQELSDVLVEAF